MSKVAIRFGCVEAVSVLAEDKCEAIVDGYNLECVPADRFLPLLKILVTFEYLKVQTRALRFGVRSGQAETVEYVLEMDIAAASGEEKFLDEECVKELITETRNDQIKYLLQKWLNKKAGIVEVKKEEDFDSERKLFDS